jgi:uncharacterized membrane protein
VRRAKRITEARVEDIRAELESSRNPQLADVIERNIGIIELLRREADARRTRQDLISDAITSFSGSMAFLYVHVAWFAIWVLLNVGLVPGIRPFDPFPFGFLTMVVSLEAIFLSTFVLISQNRQSAVTEEREALDLQIDLLAEYEITRMLRLVDKMAEHMGIEDAYDAEIDQLVEPVAPEVILSEIANRRKLGKSGV